MPVDLQTWARRLERARQRRELGIARELTADLRRALDWTARAAPASYRRSVEVRAERDTLVIASDHPAAEAFEAGTGRVHGRPRLAVPLSRSARAAGSPTTDRELVPVRTRDGRLFLMDRRTAEVRWRLVESVRAPVARPVARAVERLEEDAVEASGQALRTALGVA